MDDLAIMKDLLQYAEEHGGCLRRKIACFIMSDDGERIGRGWNGPPGIRCQDKPCPGASVPAGEGAYREVECHGVHAEVRALMDASLYADEAHSIFCTKAPCQRCAKMLLHATPDTARLVFAVWPNDKSGLEAWSDAGREYKCIGDA